MFCCCFLFIYLSLNDFSQTSYLKIYRTDLCYIFRFGRTVAADAEFKPAFRFLKGRCHGDQFLLVGYIHTFRGHSVEMAVES